MALLHFGSGLFQKVVTNPLRSHDLAGASQLHPELENDDVLLGDRAFCSFAHIALLLAGGIHGIQRAHQKLIVNFTPGRAHVAPVGGKSAHKKGQPRSRWIKKLGHQDQLVEWFKGVDKPVWMSAEVWAALPASFVVRELRYRITRPGCRVREVTLVTTLLDARQYTKNDLGAVGGDDEDAPQRKLTVPALNRADHQTNDPFQSFSVTPMMMGSIITWNKMMSIIIATTNNAESRTSGNCTEKARQAAQTAVKPKIARKENCRGFGRATDVEI